VRNLRGASILIIAVENLGLAQQPPTHRGMGHGGTSLFVAQMRGSKVVPGNPSSATATGAFMVDPTKKSVTYDLTFHGLENGPPQSIALRNFGEGENGSVLYTLCGSTGSACPTSTSGNLTGTWDGQGRPALDTNLLGEFASARTYVEIVGGNGRPEIRGQLEANGAMVPVKNFVAHLAGTASRGVGTAVLSEVHYADGRVGVFYEVSVAGISGAPRSASLTPVSSTDAQGQLKFNSNMILPGLQAIRTRIPATGGTLTGQYETRRSQKGAIFATNFVSSVTPGIAITVSTSRFPGGEISGIFKAVE